jgi:hypothetical protein
MMRTCEARLCYIDDHADDRQIEALPAIIGGRAGGVPGWVNECFAGGRQSRGIERAKITYEIAPNLGHWGVEIVGKVKAWAKAIIGPTSPPGRYPQLLNGDRTGIKRANARKHIVAKRPLSKHFIEMVPAVLGEMTQHPVAC